MKTVPFIPGPGYAALVLALWVVSYSEWSHIFLSLFFPAFQNFAERRHCLHGTRNHPTRPQRQGWVGKGQGWEMGREKEREGMGGRSRVKVGLSFGGREHGLRNGRDG